MESYNSYDELLYDNLKLLSISYPMSTKLQDILKKEMFAVASTTAFHHVIMYILNCLNEEKYGRQLPRPIHDRASHLQFNNKLWEISRSINADYPNADVPKVQKSFFMHPSGKKFVQYLVKMSSLVMLENSKFGKTFSAKQSKDTNAIERRCAALRFNLKENYIESESYKKENKITIRDLCNSIQNHENIVKNSNDTLRKVVDKSQFDAATKECLLSHNENAMKEIKEDIEKQKKRVQEFIERVKNMKTNLHELNDVIRSPQNSVCGKHLVSCLPSSIIETININEETGIALEDLMKALCVWISINKNKLLMEDLPNDFPKLIALKDNLETVLGQCQNLCCEMKNFFVHVEMKTSNANTSITEQCVAKSLLNMKETNLEYLNISTPRHLYSPSTPLTHENTGLIVDWVNKESLINKPLKEGPFFSPPSVDTSHILEDVNVQQSVAHKVKAIYLMSTRKKQREQRYVEDKSPVIVKKNNLVSRVLAMHSPDAHISNTVCAKLKAENTLNLSTISIATNGTDKDIEETVQKILQNADSFPNFSESSIFTSGELESINEDNVSDNFACDWNNESLQRIATLMQSPEPFLPRNGSSTPFLHEATHSPVEEFLSKEAKVSKKISRPSLEALRLRYLKVKESALIIPKFED